MPLITVKPSGNSFEAATGTSLLTALLAAGETIEHKCEGEAKCGSCHLFVHEGRKSLSRIGREENERLDTIIGIGSKSRLACQSILGTEDVTIELLGFASGL